MPINYRNYHPDWKDVIRPRILKRDGYKCRECGVSNKMRIVRTDGDQWLEVDSLIEKEARKSGQKIVKVILTVAHLNHIVTDNRDENLKCLCQLHHIRLDADHKNAMARIAKVWSPELAIKMSEEENGELYLNHLLVLARARRNTLAHLLTIQKSRAKYGQYSRYDKDLTVLVNTTLSEYRNLLKRTCDILSKAYDFKDPFRFMQEYWSSDLKIIGIPKLMEPYTNPEFIKSS